MHFSAVKAAPATSYGQVIEYIQDRVYLASYTHPPSETTPFPYHASSRSPNKRSSKSHSAHASRGPKVHPPVYFTVDDTLLYNRFHADFGPLHIGHLYRFAVQLHEILADPANADRGVVFWSQTDPRARANAACLLACYMVLIQSWPPHLALAPIAQVDPPLMPFRDAGYSQADYCLSVQDVVYGVWKAKEEGLCGLKDFVLEEYERYERVDMGDFNWITSQFLAFASPQHKPVATIPRSSPEFAQLPSNIDAVANSKLPDPFKNILMHFKDRNIGLVVRLNSELYSPSYFTALGIEHIDMIFDDGTCPPLGLVRNFIKLAHEMITRQKKSIAVHCKAGLGRTGCLIGAYLIYRHGFTANDLIAFMRFMRPGMVVGPQQHWLHINQGTFRQWWWEDTYKEKLAQLMPTTPSKSSRVRANAAHTATPPNSGQGTKRAALGEIDHNEGSGKAVAATTTTATDDCLPAPTPGQPRKTSRMRGSPVRAPRAQSASFGIVEDVSPPPDKEVVEVHSHRRSQGQGADGESEEEWQLRRLSRRVASSSPRSSPASGSAGRKKPRSVSYTTTTTTTAVYGVGADDGYDGAIVGCDDERGAEEIMSDVENWVSAEGYREPQLELERPRNRTPGGGARSGSGSGTIGMGKARGSPPRRATDGRDGKSGVRKTRGRVGSVSATPVVGGARGK